MSEAGLSLMAPVGPVAEAFIHDQRMITAVMGPYGSAKTTSCIRKIVQSAFWQKPGPDGVRRVRWCVVRDTYQQLETNVLNSWFTWFPKTKANWNGRQMVHRLRLEVAFLDGMEPQVIEIEAYFRAMGDQKAEDVLKGLELTGLWLNEVDTLDKGVLRFGLPRCGRYPPAKDGGCQWYGVIADFNAPDIDNWTYDLLVEETPLKQKLALDDDGYERLVEAVGSRFGIGFHRQPGGRSVDPEPENLRNLPQGYYANLLIGMSSNDIRRFVDNEFGAVRSGQPVYPEYNDELHCSKEKLKPLSALPVAMGVDGGATPAIVFGQREESGRIRWINELVVIDPKDSDVLERMGPETFGQHAGEFWKEHFGHCDFGGAWADPAWWTEGEDRLGWYTLFWRAFQEAVGPAARRWKLKPAPGKGNRLHERIEAVRRPLRQMIDGSPAFVVSSACRMIRRGFNNGYVFVRTQLSNGTGRWGDKPVKNDYSHPHDAGQCLNLGLQNRGAMAESARVQSREAKRRAGARKSIDFGSSAFAPGAGR